jgi:GT2 family glycosyltransferase
VAPTDLRVRVVVVNFNGGALTLESLNALLRSDWPEAQLEIVLVDNASSDGIADRVTEELPRVRVIRSDRNEGFAGGNNLALRDLDDVTHVALVNPDAVVEPGWLHPLVNALEHDRGLAAACPKILLFDRYGEVTVAASPSDAHALGAVRVGDVDVSDRIHVAIGDHPFVASPALPIPTTAGLRVRVPLAAGERSPVALDLGTGPPEGTHASGSFDVINNVGNMLFEDGYIADRGYLETDEGQYDEPADVFAWCGAAVLLRRDYLVDVGLFDERLFLYYEDSELSWRGSARGWRYRYVPESVVRHRHGATTNAGSRVWEYYNSRNRLLVLTRHAPWPDLRRALWHQLAVTGTRARQDLHELSGGDRPRSTAHFERLRRRARAFVGYLRYAPAMLVSRRRDRAAPRTTVRS